LTTASCVPETYELEGDDAKETLRTVGRIRLLKDSFIRFRTADGFSHVRALAHATVMTAFPVLISTIAVASVFELTTFRQVLEETIQRAAPGPAGRLLETAFRQGSNGSGAAILSGALIAALVTSTFALAQVERGCNRIYGMVRDRSISMKLGLGLALSLSAGLLLAASFVLLAAGTAISDGLSGGDFWSDTASTIFAVLRWPVGLLLAFAALTLVYKKSPNRKQPGTAWLQTATVMAAACWVGLTALLALYYRWNSDLGNTYGPLLSIIALLSWAYASAFALYFGIAFAAQLEAVRAGVPGPRTLRRYNETVRDPEETVVAAGWTTPAAPREPASRRSEQLSQT
jgi:YihY family inner membrane protein